MGQIIGISGYRYRQSSLERVRTLARGTLVTRESGPNNVSPYRLQSRTSVHPIHCGHNLIGYKDSDAELPKSQKRSELSTS